MENKRFYWGEGGFSKSPFLDVPPNATYSAPPPARAELNVKSTALPANKLGSSQIHLQYSYKEKDPIKAFYISITSKSNLICPHYQGPWLKELSFLYSQPDLSSGFGDRQKSIFLEFFGSIKPETYFAWHFSSGFLNPCALYGK